MPGVDAGWRGGARARAATQAFLSLARAPRPPANQECERQHVTGLGRPRKFEMADGLLAAGELGSEAMGPEPERTGWAAEEKGECPPGRGGGSCASPRRQSREASWATPVLPAPSDRGALGSAGRWTGPEFPHWVSAWASGARGSAASQGSEEVVTALPFPREGTGAWPG